MEDVEWTPAPDSMRRVLADMATGVGISHVIGGLIIVLFSPANLHMYGIPVNGSHIDIGVGIILVSLVFTLAGRLTRRG